MTNSQKLSVRLSEIRQRLNEIAGLDDEAMTDEVRAETDRLTNEYQAKETQHRAAVVAEADEARAAADDFNAGEGDGEKAEIRALRGRVRIGEYVGAAIDQRMAEGAEAELNAALKMRGNAFPLSLLAPAPVEARASTDTDSQTNQSGRWLDRLFADTAAERIGITMESVAPGVASFPVTTAGASAAQRGRGQAAADAVWDGRRYRVETDPECGSRRVQRGRRAPTSEPRGVAPARSRQGARRGRRSGDLPGR